MKTKIFYSAAFAFVLSSLISSCSFLQKEEFAQRKYYDFPRSKHAVDVKQTEHASVPFHKAVTEKTIAATDELKSSDEVTTASADKKPLSSSPKKLFSEKTSAPAITHLKSEPAPVELKKPNIFNAARKTAERSDSDLMLILELILAIILPPLAVYLKGGKADKWFWITLLLCILGGVFIGGLQYVGGGGLFWAIAVVIAICYVFGIIRG